jgi:hypothetical protein
LDVNTKTTPAVNSAGEQPAEDHRIRDVGDVEFVEADQPRSACDAARHGGERIGLGLERRELGVDGAHERVEMHARLAPKGDLREELVHQQALAAAHAAPQVDAARHRRRREPAAQQRTARLAKRRELVRQLLQPDECAQLRVVERRASRRKLGCQCRVQRTALRDRLAGGYRIVHRARRHPGSAAITG